MKKYRKNSTAKLSSNNDNLPVAKKRMSAYLKTFTISVFGDARVGKTALIKFFLEHEFSEDYEPTIEEYYSKHIEYNDRHYELNIIDTSGTENFPAMRRVDIQKSDVIILVYSLEYPQTFELLKKLRSEILEEMGYSVPVIVVANKSDLDVQGLAVEYIDSVGLKYNTKRIVENTWHYKWTMTSAKMGWGIEKIFHSVIDEAVIKRSQSMREVTTFQRQSSWLSKGKTSLSNFGSFAYMSLKRKTSPKSSRSRGQSFTD